MAASTNLLKLVSASRDLANRSGILIRNIFETGNLRIIDKSMKIENQKELFGSDGLNASDPQTIADIATQHLISTSLKNTFPGITIIGEEKDEIDNKHSIEAIEPLLSLPNIYFEKYLNDVNKYFDAYDIMNTELNLNDLCVWIDPIDGTKEYTEGIKNAVTCLIGISYKQSPIAGIINRPFSNQTIFGFVEIPSIFYETYTIDKDDNDKIESIKVLSRDDIIKDRDIDRRYICCSRSHLSDDIIQYIDKCKPDKIMKEGGAGNKCLLILDGECDAYIHYSKGLKKWDTCAPQALLNCIGGKLTQPNGYDLIYDPNASSFHNSNGIIASWTDKIHPSFCLNKSKL